MELVPVNREGLAVGAGAALLARWQAMIFGFFSVSGTSCSRVAASFCGVFLSRGWF